ncbi:MAG: FAD-binding oxidoreductase [Legionella sp.]|nr:FAD-binding oxidoreductase [Legionella sp.]
MSIALQNYEEKKQALIAEFKQINGEEQPIRLQKQTSNLFRQQRPQKKGIDVRQFNHVINIDKEHLIANVEGMTTYETLVNECLKFGCLPTVVPELKTITVGGALTGCGIESSSFKYGLVHETVSEFEVLLGDGSVVICTPDNEYSDLFKGFPNSYGTLGYALRICVKLYLVKPYVKLRHTHFTDKTLYFDALKVLCLQNRKDEKAAFIDGVSFDQNELYITTAEFVDDVPYISDYTYKNIYYQSIKQREEDYITTHDYIWRWDTDWFWCSSIFYAQNPVLRALWGKKRLNSATYSRLQQFFSTNKIAQWVYALFKRKTESVIQDVQIPIEKSAEFLSFFEEKIGIKPIWICPTMPYRRDINFDLYTMDPDCLYINFGFWDLKPSKEYEGYYNRLIEKKVAEFSGKKSLYSTIYYPEQEFWTIYNKKSYDTLKQKYDAGRRLRSLYEKCNEK